MNFKETNKFPFWSTAADRQFVGSKRMCIHSETLFSAPEGGTLRHLYYGNRLSETDLLNIATAEAGHTAYPEYGLNTPVETALAVKHADGNMTLQLEVLNVTTQKEGNAVTTVVALKDKVYPFFVNVCYRAWQDADVIESWD